MMKDKFSVCMSVYRGDRAEHFAEALQSVFAQTLPPQEVVLVVDGPVPESIDSVIEDFSHKKVPLKVIRLAKNSGHAAARQVGLNAARYDYVAIMDSDDIAMYDRFEKQMSFMEQHPKTDVLGGQIEEFIGSTENVIGKRVVPSTDADIKKYMKDRCPMNQMTVILQKESVRQAGGYIDWFCNEDYYLWARMLMAGMTFANMDDVLVKVRVGHDMYARRGGWRYFKSEVRLQKYMYQNEIIGGGI